jgi:hypothetical protein
MHPRDRSVGAEAGDVDGLEFAIFFALVRAWIALVFIAQSIAATV